MSWECWARIKRPSFLQEESLPLASSIPEGSAACSELSSTQVEMNNTFVIQFSRMAIGVLLLLILYWVVEVIREDGWDIIH